MKKIIETTETFGLQYLLGSKILVLCANYFYVGDFVAMDETFIQLKSPSIVYETGPWDDNFYKDVQKLPNDVYLQISFIESYMLSK